MTNLEVRELYCPAHFGNTYEVVLNGEMREILSEARFWGFNRFSDCFDPIDLYDVYLKKSQLFNLPEAMWQRKFKNFQIAADLGFEVGLGITPNHVFSDQVTSDNEAKKDGHIFGQLVCPSKSGVTAMILENYRNLFADFARRGLKLKTLSAAPYDYGGCVCEKCKPWIITFGKLVLQIAEIGREFFGPLEISLIGWWWTDDDHQKFTAWTEREAKGRFAALSFHLPYGTTEYKLRPIPADCRERAFVHISYGEKSNLDAYGHYGPPIAPSRIEKTVAYLKTQKAQGFIAYSEGVYDEINKALLAGLSSGLFDSADAVLTEYAKRHLGGDAAVWAVWLRSIGDYFCIDVVKARKEFDRLKAQSRPSWRRDQLEGRLILAETDAEVRRHKQWDTARQRAAEKFWGAKEYLFRHVWRFGLTRHICHFERPTYAPDWHKEFSVHLGKITTAEMAISDLTEA